MTLRTVALAALAACLSLSGCQAPSAAFPVVAEEATYKIYSPEGQGTAWAVDDHHAITAGHVCDYDALLDVIWPKDRPKFVMVSGQAHQVPVRVVTYLHDDESAEPQDVCLLETDEVLPATLSLASAMPSTGDRVEYYGYPAGVYAHHKGEYLGDVDGPAKWDNYTTTAPCDHGASGSAMVGPDGVFGVLVRLRVYDDGEDFTIMPGDLGCVVSPLSQIKSVMEKAE